MNYSIFRVVKTTPVDISREQFIRVETSNPEITEGQKNPKN